MSIDEKKNIKSAFGEPLDEVTLQRFIDGRLASHEQQDIQARLKRDPASRRRLDALREEDQLLGESLQKLSEPPVKISEKVMTALYAEFNKQQRIIRVRRFRRKMVVALSAAALVMVAVLSIQPRPHAGVFVSGKGQVEREQQHNIPLKKGVLLYPGDRLVTGLGQFLRVNLAEGSILELGELTRVHITKFKDHSMQLELETGQIHATVGVAPTTFNLKAKGGLIHAPSNTSLKLWIPKSIQGQWPKWAEPFQSSTSNEDSLEAASVACVFVSQGQVRLVVRKQNQTVKLSARQLFRFNDEQTFGQPLQLKTRPISQDDRWSRYQSSQPQSRAVLGMLKPIDWNALSTRMGLMKNLPGGKPIAQKMNVVFRDLDNANAIIEPDQRAEAFGKALLELRATSESLVLRDARRWRERTIEGLIHLERGRALLVSSQEAARASAQEAFLAACFAFEEALSGGESDIDPDSTTDTYVESELTRAPGLDTFGAPTIDVHTAVSSLSADDEAHLLTMFFRPWAQYHLVRAIRSSDLITEEMQEQLKAHDPIKAFQQADQILGRSVEVLAIRYGMALASMDAGDLEKAESLFRDIESTSVAGLTKRPRIYTKGLHQAALVKMAEMFSKKKSTEELQEVLDLFRFRYPLDSHSRAGIALRIIQKRLDK